MSGRRLDLLITGRRVHTSAGFRPLAVGIRGGRIETLCPPKAAPEAEQTYDAGDHPVLPGLIDPHTHMRDPGLSELEDWENGTRAAAAGGITCVFDQPNSIPPVSSAEGLEAKRESAERQAVVDFGLFGGAGEGSLERMAELAEAGAIAFKTFLWPYQDRAEEFEGLWTVDDAALYQVFERAAELGLPACVHAESHALVRLFSERMRTEGRTAPIDHQAGRPVVAEVEAVWRCMLLAGHAGAHLHLLHVSSGSGASTVATWRAQGRGEVTLETCPTYLTLTEERLAEVGPYAKINPPLRSAEEQALLWRRIRDGTVDTLGSDHGPHLFRAKEPGWQDIYAAPAGAPGVETSLPIMLTHVHHGRLSLERLVELMSARVACVFGLLPRKGLIGVGADADFTVVDLERRGTIDPERLQVKDARVARIFEGFETVGAPILTVVRGHVVMRDGQVIGEPGWGRMVRP